MIRYEIRRKLLLTTGDEIDIHHRTYYDKTFAENQLRHIQQHSQGTATIYIREVDYDCSSSEGL